MSHDLLLEEWNDIKLKDPNRNTSNDSLSLALVPPSPNDRKVSGGEESSLSRTGTLQVHSDLNNSVSAAQIKKFNTSEASKLLEITSDSSTSESDLNLQLTAPKRKVRFKRKFRPIARNKSKLSSQDSPSCPTCRCTDSLGIFAAISIAVSVIVVIWFQYNLRSQVNDLHKQYVSLEAQSKETPEALHDYHIQLKSLEFNVTSFSDELKKLSSEISSISEEFKLYKATTNSLKESIAAAPEMKSLPKDVITVSQTTAALGSKITLLEALVNDLKTEHKNLKESSENIIKDHEIIKANVSALASKAAIKEISSRNNQQTDQSFKDSIVAYVQKEVLRIDESVDELNSSLTPKVYSLLIAVDSLHGLNDSVVGLSDDLKSLQSYVYYNLSRFNGSPDVILDQALNNKIAAALSSTNNKNGTWQYLLQEAAQISILYQDLSVKISSYLSSTSPKPGSSSGVVVDNLFSLITQSCFQDVQSLNQSLVDLSAKQESFQVTTNQSIDALTAKTEAVSTKLAEIQQGLNPAAEAPAQAKSDPQFVPSLNQKKSNTNPSLGSNQEEQPSVHNPVPTKSKLLDTLRLSRPGEAQPGEMLR